MAPSRPHATAAARYDPQGGSMLFRKLPQETRDQVYAELFAATRFNIGERPVGRTKRLKFRPAPDGLALVRTCRRAHAEVGSSWLRHVSFFFEELPTMLDKLSALPPDALAQLRHVTVRGKRMWIGHPEDDDPPVYYSLAAALKLLPGQQLDRLTVLGEPTVRIGYKTLTDLISHGNGWKTLRYISHSSALLGFAAPIGHYMAMDSYQRSLQPTHWQTLMDARDGAASSPSVAVYQAKEPSVCGAILDPTKRVKFEQKLEDGEDDEAVTRAADLALTTEDGLKKEMMVVVRRGTGVAYAETEDSPLLEDDMRRDIPGIPWDDIRYMGMVRDEDEDGDYSSDASGEPGNWPFSNPRMEPCVWDKYEHVDDYGWTEGHMHDNIFTF